MFTKMDNNAAQNYITIAQGVHLRALHPEGARILLLLLLHAFPAYMRQGASADKLQSRATTYPTPCWIRQIQARPNQPWARCSVFLPPPASRGQLKLKYAYEAIKDTHA